MPRRTDPHRVRRATTSRGTNKELGTSGVGGGESDWVTRAASPDLGLHAFRYEASDIPPGMTIREYQARRLGNGRQRARGRQARLLGSGGGGESRDGRVRGNSVFLPDESASEEQG